MKGATAEIAAELTGQPKEVYTDDSRSGERAADVLEVDRIRYPVDESEITRRMTESGRKMLILTDDGDLSFRLTHPLNEIAKMLSGNEGEVKLFLQRGMMLVEVNDTILTSRLYAGEFINRDAIFPKSFNTFVKVRRKDFEESVERAAILVRSDKNNLIILDIKDNYIGITSNSDIGGVSEVVGARVEGPELKIAMNSKYILECARAVNEEFVYIEFNSNVSPFIVHGEEKENCCYLILPVRAGA